MIPFPELPARKYGTWRKRAKSAEAMLELCDRLLREKTGKGMYQHAMLDFGVAKDIMSLVTPTRITDYAMPRIMFADEPEESSLRMCCK